MVNDRNDEKDDDVGKTPAESAESVCDKNEGDVGTTM